MEKKLYFDDNYAYDCKYKIDYSKLKDLSTITSNDMFIFDNGITDLKYKQIFENIFIFYGEDIDKIHSIKSKLELKIGTKIKKFVFCEN